MSYSNERRLRLFLASARWRKHMTWRKNEAMQVDSMQADIKKMTSLRARQFREKHIFIDEMKILQSIYKRLMYLN